jgi:hypothetical protein
MADVEPSQGQLSPEVQACLDVFDRAVAEKRPMTYDEVKMLVKCECNGLELGLLSYCAITLAGLYVSQDIDVLAEWSGLSKGDVAYMVNNLREGGVWVGDGAVHCEWLCDHGDIEQDKVRTAALLLDSMVAAGLMSRRLINGEIAYKMNVARLVDSEGRHRNWTLYAIIKALMQQHGLSSDDAWLLANLAHWRLRFQHNSTVGSPIASPARWKYWLSRVKNVPIIPTELVTAWEAAYLTPENKEETTVATTPSVSTPAVDKTEQEATPLNKAAVELDTKLRGLSWYNTIGMDETNQQLYLYIKSIKGFEKASKAVFKDGFQGFPVIVKHMGTARPCGEFWPK